MRSYSKDRPNQPIAVVGCGLRFPGGSNTPAKLWDLLREPRDVRSTIPTNRFNPDGFYHSAYNHLGTSHTRHGYFLNEDHRQFDAEFFGIKPVEANSMDPQQRLLLEVIYEGIEAAGLSLETLRGSSTAVYVGLMAVDYSDMFNRDTSDYPPYVAGGAARSMISNRVSYFFDWRGPSMTIDTACSSSLVAVHQAVQTLRAGESQVAVAAGANLLLGPEQFIAGSSMKMLSPDGRSYMWDSRANGYARGEGIAAIVLKTSSTAIADGDNVECVIVETGLNQDGRTKGLTVPSAAAQATLIDRTYKKAGLDLTRPSDRPQYFEAHGTGTPTGDPIEAEAIHNAFFRNTQSSYAKDRLYCGSVKTVIGHTEGTAGLAGLIKASLALRHGIIPPNLLFENLAPAVKPFYDKLKITTTAKPWPALAPGSVRRASVNSFGFGGTNAHCILESYCPVKSERVKDPIPGIPFVFSATSEKSLSAVLTSYLHYLKSERSINLRALSHTLCTKRTTFPVRTAFSASNVGDLCTKLDSFLRESGAKPTLALSTLVSPLRILRVFTGQGAQWAGMARSLMRFPAAIQIIDDLERSLEELSDPPSWSLKAELSADISSSRITEAAIAQPACTAVQILLVKMLRAAGIRFSAVVGHSSGEIAAAFAADCLSARDAIRIAYYRGVHLSLVGGRDGETGAMIAVGASYEEAQAICSLDQFRGKICVAASNSASSVTLSGDATAIHDVRDMFHAKNRFARLLKVDNAYHSPHMIRCSEAITTSLRACNITSHRRSLSNCLWVSSVYGQDIKMVTDSLDDLYWHNNTINPVLFSQALEHTLQQSNFDLAVEVGAHPALKGPALQVVESALGHTIPYTGVLNRKVDDVEAFSNGLGYIWANLSNNIVDFAGYDRILSASDPPNVLKGLPPYPWDHERAFWYESRASHTFRHRRGHHELLGTRTSSYSGDQMSWKNYLVPSELSWLSDHRIQGQMMFPGAGYLVSAFEAAREAAVEQPIQLIELSKFTFGQPLVFDSEDCRVEVLISLTDVRRRKSTLTANFTYHSIAHRESSPMLLNAKGQLNVLLGTDAGILQTHPERLFGMTKVDHERIYTSLASCGYHYSGPFRALNSVERKLGVASGLVQTPDVISRTALLIHPATLDAAIHSIPVAYSYPGDGRLTSLLLPTGVSKICIDPGQALSSSCDEYLRFASFSRDHGERTEGDVDLYSANGQNTILRLEGLRTKPMTPATLTDDVHMFSETVWGPAFPILKNAFGGSNPIRSCLEEDSQMMAATARQISHRYPAMNILEIGASAANATKVFLTGLDDALASYTYTEISDEGLDRARTVFEPHGDKLIYKILDTEIDIVDQGYAEHSFDLVVAFWSSSNIPKLDHTMTNVRRLLKPGGYFLCPKVTKIGQPISDFSPNTVADPCFKGACERPSSPPVDILERRQTLKRYGFVDSTDPPVETVGVDSANHRIMLIQAVDDRILFLRKPLVSAEEHSCFSDIKLVGGATSATFACIGDLMGILQAKSGRITQVETLSDLVDADLVFSGTVLVLQDHDKPAFEDMDDKRLKGLQKLFERSKNVLWVTHGYKRNLTHARMLVAFMRCLLQEMPHVRLQVLDLTSSDALDATLISEHLLRLLATGRWEEQGRLTDILWSVEPEVSHENGQDFIPRVKLSKALNSRYNSARRLITLPIDPREMPVAVSIKDNTYILKAKDEFGLMQTPKRANVVTIRVTHSFLKAVRVERCGFFYLLLGADSATHEQVIALSSTLSSEVDVPRSLVRACSLPQPKAVEYLHALFCGLVSCTILHGLAPGESVLVLEPQTDVAAILTIFAAAKDIQAVFFTAAHNVGSRSTWTKMPSRVSAREVNAALPDGTLSRVICWKDDDWTSNLRDKIPNNVPIDAPGFYVATGGSPTSLRAIADASDVFERVQGQLALTNVTSVVRGGNVLPLTELHRTYLDVDAMTVVDWTVASKVPVKVERADERALFCRDKTYWLVGLTGDLGLSLCQWMISRGATHIVLSSRNPKVNPQWLTHFESLGATVRVYANDVTDHNSVKSTYERIETGMPPVAGVCHGAMVLQDALVQDLDMSQVGKVLKPKVNGAIYLDQIFQHHKLDFFIALSSIAAITGNPGQAVYAAANGFLAALTAQRRARGYPASTVNLGAVLGAGATQGLTLAQQNSLQKAGVMWTSEQDFHSAFAEAVVASSPRSNSNAEFTTGVRTCYADEEYKPKHASSPIFAHLLLQRNVADVPTMASIPAVHVKTQLLKATTSQAVFQTLQSFLSSKLRKALQTPPDAPVIEQTADTLGIDSLIAVEMRSWFMKELSVDMPVLVIIGGSTMRGVLEKAMELLDPSMTPSLSGEAHTGEKRVPDRIDSAEPRVIGSGGIVKPVMTHAASASMSAVQTSRTETGATNSTSSSSKTTNLEVNHRVASSIVGPATAVQLTYKCTDKGMDAPNTPPGASTPETTVTDHATSASLLVAPEVKDPTLDSIKAFNVEALTTRSRSEGERDQSTLRQDVKGSAINIRSVSDEQPQSRATRPRRRLFHRILQSRILRINVRSALKSSHAVARTQLPTNRQSS